MCDCHRSSEIRPQIRSRECGHPQRLRMDISETKRWLPHAGHRRHTLVYLEELLAPSSGPLLTGDHAHDRKDAGWLLRSASKSCLLSQTRSACAPMGQPEPAPGLRAPQQLIRLQVLHPDVTRGQRMSSLVSGKRLTAHAATASTCSECLSCRWSVRCWPPAAREVEQASGQEAWAAPCSVAIPWKPLGKEHPNQEPPVGFCVCPEAASSVSSAPTARPRIRSRGGMAPRELETHSACVGRLMASVRVPAQEGF